MCGGGLCGSFNFGVGGVGVIEMNVFVGGISKNNSVLWYKCDLSFEICMIYVM